MGNGLCVQPVLSPVFPAVIVDLLAECIAREVDRIGDLGNSGSVADG